MSESSNHENQVVNNEDIDPELVHDSDVIVEEESQVESKANNRNSNSDNNAYNHESTYEHANDEENGENVNNNDQQHQPSEETTEKNNAIQDSQTPENEKTEEENHADRKDQDQYQQSNQNTSETLKTYENETRNEEDISQHTQYQENKLHKEDYKDENDQEKQQNFDSEQSNLDDDMRKEKENSSKSQDRNYHLTEPPKIQVRWQDLEYRVKVTPAGPPSDSNIFQKAFFHLGGHRFHKQDKQILYPMSCYAQPGEIVALMGPSGSGKTSLLNIISQRVKQSGGELLGNGEKLKKEFRSLSAFVRQEDVLMGNVTVKETLMYAALLKLPSKMSFKEKRQRVHDVMEELGLSAVADTHVGTSGFSKGISGGEKKRLNIAIEIITEPAVIFLDEITSGLDSKTALNVMEICRKIAKKGRTIVMSIHQPRSNIFEMFDKLLLLAKGRVAYFGSIENSTEYFKQLGYPCPSKFNPADHFLDMITITTSDTDTDAKEKEMKRIEYILDQYGRLYQYMKQQSRKHRKIQSTERNGTTKEITQENSSNDKTNNESQEDETKYEQHERDQKHSHDSNENNEADGDAQVSFDSRTDIQLDEEIMLTSKEKKLLDLVTNPIEPPTTENYEKNLSKYAVYNSRWITQVLVLGTRSFLHVFRDKFLTFARFFQVVIIALIGGLVFFDLGYTPTNIQDRLGLLFFSLLNQSIGALIPAITIFLGVEKAVFLRERSNKTYQVSAYFLGKSFAELLWLIIFPILFCVIVYWMSGLRADAGAFFLYILIIIVAVLTAHSLGILVGVSVPSLQVSNTLLPIIIVTLIVLGGFYKVGDDIPDFLIWAYWISMFRYGFEALVLNEFQGLNFTELTPPSSTSESLDVSGSSHSSNVFTRMAVDFVSQAQNTELTSISNATGEPTCDSGRRFQTGQDVIDFYGFNTAVSNPWIDIGILLAMFTFLMTCAYFVLRFRVTPTAG